MTNHYDVLGVAKNATQDDIKKAYRKLAQKYHPDRYDGDDAKTKFQEVSNAYKVLKDPQTRAAYDNPQPEGFAFRTGNTGGGNINDILREMAESMMGRGGRQQQYPMANVQISLEESYTGTKRTLNGNEFSIPAGVRSGNQLLVDGFIIVINVARHAKFKRSNDDLLTAIQINAVEAMLGIECNLTNIDGKIIKVKIPAGIQNGKLVRVAGKGMPNPEYQNVRGDLLVQVGIVIPQSLTDEEKECIMKLQHRKSFDA